MRSLPAAELGRRMRSALVQRGLTEEHAGWVADGLAETSLRGTDTHGVRLFATYLAELDGGRSRARPDLRWTGEGRAARVLDAGGALGIVAGRTACAEAVRLARDFGVGAVAVRGSNHFGAASVYTLEMARQGAVGIACTNSDALVAPFGGVAPFFGTNPVSVAAEGEGGDLFCADLATSQVSYSKVKHHRAHGLPLEPGWVVEGTGDEVVLEPLGAGSGHKGQCLGMAVTLLCALLTGMPADHELTHLYAPPYDEPRQVSHFFLALDPGAFRDHGEFRIDLARWLGLVRTQPGRGDEPVRVPGDPERDTAAVRERDGIPLTEEEWRVFEGLG